MASASSSSGTLQGMVGEVTDSTDTASSSLSCDQMDKDMDWYFTEKDEEDGRDADIETDSQDSFHPTSQPRDKGKGRLIETETEEKPFPIMDLPTEIRLEIYRACLTRPKKILLSKVEKPLQPEEPAVQGAPQVGSDSIDWNEQRREALEMYQRARASRGLDPVVYDPASRTLTTPDSARASRRMATTNRLRSWTSRNNRLSNLSPAARSSSASAPSSTTSTTSVNSVTDALNISDNLIMLPSTSALNTSVETKPATDSRPKNEDALIINILRVSKQIYKEARDVLYSENVFDLDITTAVTSLAALHQRSRRHIKHVELEIPTYTEILERFSEVVRLSLRYCTGLKTFVIHTPFTLPGADGSMSASNTTVYANGFDILRWLPQKCHVVLEGCHNPEIDAVVNKHLNLAKTQDEVSTVFYLSHPCKVAREDGFKKHMPNAGLAPPSSVAHLSSSAS